MNRFRTPIRTVVESIAVLLALTFLTVVTLGLTRERFRTAIPPDAGDPFFVLYLFRWVGHQAALGLPDFWHANFFFPHPAALTFSDHLAGPAVVFGLLVAAGASTAAAYNLLLVASFPLAGLAMFDVARRFGRSTLASVIVAVAFAFSHVRLRELPHLQMLLAVTVPWTLLAFDRFLTSPRPHRLAAWLALHVVNLLGAVYVGFGQHLALAGVALARWSSLRRGWRVTRRRTLLIAGGVSAVLLSVLAYAPYLGLERTMDFGGSMTWVSRLRTTSASWLEVTRRSALADWIPAMEASPWGAGLWPGVAVAAGLVVALQNRIRIARAVEAFRRPLLFAGGVALVLAAVSAADWITWHSDLAQRSDFDWARRGYRLTGLGVVAGTALAARALWSTRLRSWLLAPSSAAGFAGATAVALFATHPVGHFLLRQLVPGFDALRVAGRLALFALPGILLLAAEGIDRLRAVLGPVSGRIAVIALLALQTADGLPRRSAIRWVEVPEGSSMPEDARWLAGQTDVRAILELPWYGDWREARRMYGSTAHWRPLVNGYSSYVPGFTLGFSRWIARLPDADAVERLARIGVSHVVFHLDALPKATARRMQQEWLGVAEDPTAALELVRQTRRTLVFRVRVADPERLSGADDTEPSSADP